MRLVKRSIERLTVLTGIPRLLARRRAGEVLILAYHNVLPSGRAGAGERSLHVSYDEFVRQLDLLAREAAVVPLTDALRPSRGADPTVAITFDDAYRGALTVAVPELAARGLPATMFVAPGLLPDCAFWWDRLAAGTQHGAIPERVRERALTELGGQASRVLGCFAADATAAASIPPECRSGSMTEIVEALSIHAGLSLGAHSWSHPNLASLAPSDLERELTEPLVWLRTHFPRAMPVLAYPYGLSSDAVASAARDCGYVAGLTIAGGWGSPGKFDQFAVPRLNVPAGVSVDGLALRLAGLRGRAA